MYNIGSSKCNGKREWRTASLPRRMEGVKKKLNSSNSVMYISVCLVSYIAVVMFTCKLVRSHPDSRRRWVKLNCCHKQLYVHRVGHDNKLHARKKGPELGSVHAQSEAMKDVFPRCHKKTTVQVCTLTIMHYYPVTVNFDAMMLVLVSDIGNPTLLLCMY
jgi:hypothetical protein